MAAEEESALEPQWRDSEFITECLFWHNAFRHRHAAPPLSISTQLCSHAQSWANHLAHTNSFHYKEGERSLGQNLFCRNTHTLQSDVAGQEVASHWYSAVRQYDYLKEPDILHANVNAGHFTQMVWVGSKELGLGKARSRSGKVVVVANYRPAGNISGQFQQNVLPPIELDLSSSPGSGGGGGGGGGGGSTGGSGGGGSKTGGGGKGRKSGGMGCLWGIRSRHDCQHNNNNEDDNSNNNNDEDNVENEKNVRLVSDIDGARSFDYDEDELELCSGDEGLYEGEDALSEYSSSNTTSRSTEFGV
ncbi:uncharacterized protein [Hetaerina americana]|uniref:uncharacterized protein n=1 Tax=Hetaerina americana TaxID=62018 RepID=UPI003A7F22DD